MRTAVSWNGYPAGLSMVESLGFVPTTGGCLFHAGDSYAVCLYQFRPVAAKCCKSSAGSQLVHGYIHAAEHDVDFLARLYQELGGDRH